ncbi:MAG TPA: YihY/virulence factor BrkB family protein [Mycobacteriales bacterium]|nr:YihY/virulence factor BrkB family protein [Mycobacteriales bacterium]
MSSVRTDVPSRAPGTVATSAARAVWHAVRVAGGLARATVAKAWQDRILGLSAEAAFWQLLSLPPLLLAGLGALGYVGPLFGTNAVASVQRWVLRGASEVVAPGVVDAVVQPVVTEVLSRGRPDIVSIGFVLGLWAGSSATATFVNTITIAYGQRELRGAVPSRLLALGLYLAFLTFGAVLLTLLVIGPDLLLEVLPAGWREPAEMAVHLAYWPVTALLTLLALTTLYHVVTPVRLAWRRAFPGAVLAMVLFGLLSFGLRLYVETVASQLMVFSALAAPILALLYFYVLAFAILLGAELNAALEQRWPRGSRPGTLERLGLRRNDGTECPRTPPESPQSSPPPPPPPRGSDS